MQSRQILATFAAYNKELETIWLCVYGASTGEQLWRDVFEKYKREDARAIIKAVHQLYMDADDTASFLQDTIWDVVEKLNNEYVHIDEAFKATVAASVSVKAVPIEEEDDEQDI